MEKPVRPEMTINHEENNVLEYPKEYFDAQVLFAFQWSRFSGEPLADSLRKRTVISRRIDDKLSDTTMEFLLTEEDPDVVAEKLYQMYSAQPSSVYVEKEYARENDFGFFGYDYLPDNPYSDGKDTIKIHFLNNSRGEKSGLSTDYLEQRQGDIKRLVSTAVERHGNIDEVIGGSWLYNLPAYRASFPPEFCEAMTLLVPPEIATLYPDASPNMSLRGNSVWGQFVDRKGWVAKERYQNFMNALVDATNLVDLYEAFPFKPLQPKGSPDIFLS